VRKVAENEQYFTDDIKEKMMQTLLSRPVKDNVSQDGVLISSLTKRELQVLKLVAQQYSTREIADELHISESTVETHRKNLMKKVRVKNSVGLAIFALKNEVI
jgi:DNA-binding NarL/FixJ family response regulator